MPQLEPIEIKCGELITSSSAESVGLKNYTVKRDFRRIAPDRDARREGFIPFQPNQAHATTPANLPSSTGNPILRKICQVRAGNGKVAVIVANADSLFRYFSLEVGNYFAGDGTANSYFIETDPSDPASVPYFQETFQDWVQIGSGFSPAATYWEAIQVNNTLVLNNGIDLPVTFNVEDQTVTPIYELRDQGVASVGTIWEYNGILMCGNIVEISNVVAPGQNIDPLTALMNRSLRYSRISTIDPIGNLANAPIKQWIVSEAGQVQLEMTGNFLPYLYDGMPATISGETLHPCINGNYTVNISGCFYATGITAVSLIGGTCSVPSFDLSATATLSTTSIYTAQYIASITNDFQYRVIWSMPGEPSRFAASIPCSTVLGSRHLFLNWPSQSFTAGQQILILGAGLNGGNLSATILWINPNNGADLFLDATILSTVQNTSVQSLDSVGSIVGYEDLDDDGSAVIRGASIMTSVAIYKDTSIFVCNYTGTAGSPFTFQKVYQGDDSIFYRNTLVPVVHNWQSWHFFAGRNSLLKFDLINLTPTVVYREIDNLFFGNEGNLIANPVLVWASRNPVTNEIFLANPGNGSDTVLCFDYKFNTTSTSSMQATCGASVQFPTANIVEQGTNVFLMGDANNIGALIQYGRKDDGSAPVLSRCTGLVQGTPYTSILASGLSSFGARSNDSYVNGYELRVNKLTGRVTLALIGGSNPAATSTTWSVDRTNAGELFIPCGQLAQVFGDSINVTDANVQCEVVARVMFGEEIDSQGAGRS